ncbi:MFS transporter [Streptomyces sp. SP18CS02]|uniref:MFS transporter n=1 Tax=Streptomyces sp. SP18CS02 TaxID=3002531 RepID=UPI002E78D562|nr:MFS transporter [Streptomyces sp. SP18CS02]MEE1756651.1 hypothetical protein [Streptomyces sp. SP18CS02]
MSGHGRPVLLAAAGLHMVTQSALAPFYPALFRAAYGVEELAATGLFLMLCQVAAVVALPLWGRATRRVPLARLVTAGQSAAVLLAGALVLAPSYAVFTVVSVLLVAAKAVVLLAYPGLARSHRRGVLPGVVQYVAVLHAASVVATLLGGLVVSVPDPRTALPLLALLEAVLLVACARVLRPAPVPAAGAVRPVADPDGPLPTGGQVTRLAVYVLITAVAVYAARPYFTEYATGAGAPAALATVLFVLPHTAVLAVLPAAGRLRARFGERLLPGAMLLAAVALGVQATVTDPLALGGARLVFGAGLGLGQVALDERVITTNGTGAAYSLIAMAQTCGLLLAPLVATATATAALWAPLLAGAVLLAALAFLAPVSVRPTRPAPRPVGGPPLSAPGTTGMTSHDIAR